MWTEQFHMLRIASNDTLSIVEIYDYNCECKLPTYSTTLEW